MLLLHPDDRLAGLFTDSDLARLIETRRDDALDGPIATVMTAKPYSLPLGARVAEAMELMQNHKISELPILDTEGRAVGLIDITDLVGMQSAAETLAQPRRQTA